MEGGKRIRRRRRVPLNAPLGLFFLLLLSVCLCSYCDDLTSTKRGQIDRPYIISLGFFFRSPAPNLYVYVAVCKRNNNERDFPPPHFCSCWWTSLSLLHLLWWRLRYYWYFFYKRMFFVGFSPLFSSLYIKIYSTSNQVSAFELYLSRLK